MRRSLALAAVLVLVVVPTVGAALAPSGATQPQQTAQNATGQYSLADLREDGTHYSKPSARIADQNVYWLTHEPAEQPWQSEKQLLERETVKADELYLNTIRVDPEPQPYTVHMVFWNKGVKTVQSGANATSTEPVARNVTEVTRRVTLGQGWPTAEISLPHHQTPTRMTIWIDGLGDEARWTLQHHSIATTNAAGIDSEGDYLYRASTEFIIPIIIGTFAVSKLRNRALDAAGVGPMWGLAPWIVLITVLSGFVLIGMFGSFAEVFVHLPLILAVYVTAIIGVVLLESDRSNVIPATFLQPLPEAATSASGEHALDSRKYRKRREKLLKSPEDGIAIVRSGLTPFLARIWGRTARLEGIEDLDTEMEQIDGDDHLFVVAPGSDQVIRYEPEGFRWGGSPGLVLAATGLATLGLWNVHSPAMGVAAGAATFALGALLWLEATDGYASIKPAPGHLRSAWVTSLFMTRKSDEAETLRASRQKRVAEAAHNEKHVEEELEARDRTLVQEMEDPQERTLGGRRQRTNGHAGGDDD